MEIGHLAQTTGENSIRFEFLDPPGICAETGRVETTVAKKPADHLGEGSSSAFFLAQTVVRED